MKENRLAPFPESENDEANKTGKIFILLINPCATKMSNFGRRREEYYLKKEGCVVGLL